jgi:hypothetical protein
MSDYLLVLTAGTGCPHVLIVGYTSTNSIDRAFQLCAPHLTSALYDTSEAEIREDSDHRMATRN